VFLRNTPNISPKLAEIAENSHHNIDPSSVTIEHSFCSTVLHQSNRAVKIYACGWIHFCIDSPCNSLIIFFVHMTWFSQKFCGHIWTTLFLICVIAWLCTIQHAIKSTFLNFKSAQIQTYAASSPMYICMRARALCNYEFYHIHRVAKLILLQLLDFTRVDCVSAVI
jgi:hypothetical protein